MAQCLAHGWNWERACGMDFTGHLLGDQHRAQNHTWALCESICLTQRSSGGTRAHPPALLKTQCRIKNVSSQIVCSPLQHLSDCKITQQAKTGLAFFLCPNVLRRIQRQDCSLKFQRLNELVEFCFATLKVHKDLYLWTSSPGFSGLNMNHVDMFFLWGYKQYLWITSRHNERNATSYSPSTLKQGSHCPQRKKRHFSPSLVNENMEMFSSSVSINRNRDCNQFSFLIKKKRERGVAYFTWLSD